MAIIRTIEGTPVDLSPGIYAESNGGGRIGVDPSGALKTRGAVLTDEGGYRNNFAGTSFFLNMGTCVFTNGSITVTGTGFDTNRHMRVGDYVKLTADPDTNLAQIKRIIDDSTLQLTSGYSGTSATGPGSTGKLNIKMGAGCSYSIVNGALAIISGTTSGSVAELERDVDYTPLTKQTAVAVSQRTAQQTITIGFYDDHHASPQYWTWFKLTGNDSSSVICESAFSKDNTPTVYETEATTIRLPQGVNTTQSLRYRIEALEDRVRFLINGLAVAEHFKSIPVPYSELTSTIRITNNTTLGSSTTISVDYDSVLNYNRVVTSPVNDGDPAAATTNDLETLVDLVGQLLSRTPLPDAAGRVRANIETSTAASVSTNVAQMNAIAVLMGTGVTGTGSQRVTMATPTMENIVFNPGNLPIIYNAIVVS